MSGDRDDDRNGLGAGALVVFVFLVCFSIGASGVESVDRRET